jgi:putative ABC transport system permease protein
MFLPFAPGTWHDGFERVGKADMRPNLPMADFFMVSPEYLGTVGIPIRRGRDLAPTDDTPGAPGVVVVSETFAAKTFPGEAALGRRVRWEDRTWEIVGIAADARHSSLWDAPDPDVYVPRGQKIRDNTWLVVRTSRPASVVAVELRAKLGRLDPGAALTDVRTLDERLSASVAPERFRALLTGSLGGLALVLAAIGVNGVVSYASARMTREIGIRMALGQTCASVMSRILVTTWTTMAYGVALGLVSAAVAARWLEASLPGVHTSQAGTMIAVAAIFFAVATLAALGPARRASRVDLVAALRTE